MTKQDNAFLRIASALRGDVRQRIAPSGPTEVQAAPAPDGVEWAASTLKLDFAEAAARRRRGFLLRLLIFVGIPTLVSAFYVFMYATPRYVSQIQVVYQSYGAPQSQAPSFLSTFLGSSIGGLDMQRVIGSYVTSDTLLASLERQLPMHEHYSNPKIDWLDRLPAKASEEDFVAYFNKRIHVDVMQGGYDVINIEAFDPKFAAQVAAATAASIDQMVEGITTRARADELNFAQGLLDKAEERLIAAKLKTTAFRNAHREFDPLATATTLETGVVAPLEAQLSQYRAELASREPFLAPDSPTIVSLKSQIGALEQQIAAERARLANSSTSGPGVPYSDLVAQYTTLTENEQFALDSYTSAKQAYDLARADAERKQNYAEAFVKANVPQRSTSPNGPMVVLATFVISLLTYAAGSLLFSSFREQAGA
jgi:capsular polysaccharide transport system permease protein